MNQDFRSIHIDLEKGIYEINGKSIIGEHIVNLKLTFNGLWDLKYEKEMIETNKKNSILES